MDVLRYSATNARGYLQDQITQKNSCITTKSSETVTLQQRASLFSAEYSCWVRCIEPSLLLNPEQTSLWSCIPAGSGWTGGFTVCGDDGTSGLYMSQGKDCTWTVPAGVTCARFQIWGAGSGSGSGGMCCSISPFGATGAFVSIMIPVTAGNQYVIHSGCAPRTCAYCAYSSQRAPGDKSFVQGPGLCNVCAEGGHGEIGHWMTCHGRFAVGACYFGSKCIPTYGYATCGEGSFACWSPTGVGVCCILPFTPGANYFGSSPVGSLYGIRGMYSALCSCGNNNAACYCHPPVYGFLSTSQCTVFYDGICCGASNQACCGTLRVPSAGGWPSSAFSGATGMYGDCSGRFGMVCVCFK